MRGHGGPSKPVALGMIFAAIAAGAARQEEREMKESFDEYCERMKIKPGEEPAAFAAWMNSETGWDGPMREVLPDDVDPTGQG